MKFQLSYILYFAAAAAVGCQASASGSFSTQSAASAETEEVEVAEASPPAADDPDDVHIEGDHLVIDRHINFATNSDEILEDSFDLLDHIAQLLKNHPEIAVVHVVGHTDSAGSADHNQKLSERRANSVMEALKSRGIPQRIDAAGKGKSEHLCHDNTDECHQKNRRVEFIIERAEG